MTETTRYRAKPVEVEARQLLGGEGGEPARTLAAWCGGWIGGSFTEPHIVIPTLEGEMRATVGDWVIRGVQGEFYPCKPDIFEQTYEPAAAPSAPADRAALLRELASSIQSGDVPFGTEAAEAALKNGGPFALIAYVQLAIGEHLRRMADEAQPEAPLRAELKPWQLLGDASNEPLPQTERLVGGRRLTRGEAQQPEARKACGCGQDGCEYCDVDDDAGEAHQSETQGDTRAAIVAELLPVWEAVYEPGNVSDYLIGYANSEAAAKGAAEAWLRSQAEVTGRLEWVPEERLATGRYDQWFELIERHDGEIDTGPGLIVRRRVADEARAGAGERR